MKNYIIGFSYVEFAKVQVQAESQEDAERRVYEQLEEQGMPDDADAVSYTHLTLPTKRIV